jgi:hypothetical protein
MDEANIERVHCNECGLETKHFIVATRERSGSWIWHSAENPDGPGLEISWSKTYSMLECCGCESVSLKYQDWFSEDYTGEDDITYYPPRISRRQPSWLHKLPVDMESLMSEVYTALQAGSRRLTMMGARAVLEMFILGKVGDVGNFGQKLIELQKHGYLSSRNAKVLRAALDAGSAAAHRGHQASVEEVQQVIDIVENILHADLLESAADQLQQSTPPRLAQKR